MVGEEKTDQITRRVSIATGQLAYPTIRMLADELESRFSWVRVQVYPIRNDFFGERITVTGLLTGQDIISQLKGEDLGEALLLPENLLRAGEDVLLDDITIGQIADSLQVPVNIIQSEGRFFVARILGSAHIPGVFSKELFEEDFDGSEDIARRTGNYEPKSQ